MRGKETPPYKNAVCSEIFCLRAKCEIKSTFQVDFVEKSTCVSKCFFLSVLHQTVSRQGYLHQTVSAGISYITWLISLPF